jgi:hypothetical protein
MIQLPQMDEQGLKVIIMDNCNTHKSNTIRELIEDEGVCLLLSCLKHDIKEAL